MALLQYVVILIIVHHFHALVIEHIPTTCKYLEVKKTPVLYEELNVAKRDDTHIVYNFCKPIPASYNCGTDTHFCIINANLPNGRISVSNLTWKRTEKKFFGTFIHTPKNVTLSIYLDQSTRYKPRQPKLDVLNPFDYEVSMVDPLYSPPCTTNVYGQFVNMKNFQKTLSVKDNSSGVFYITPCAESGLDSPCASADIHVCHIKTDKKGTKTVQPISLDTHLSYNTQKQELSLRGSYRDPKSDQPKITFDLELECDWSITDDSLDVTLLKSGGRSYKFKAQSHLGCVKVPLESTIYDDYLAYNISQLGQFKDYWNVKNVPDKTQIFINLPNALNLPNNVPKSNICSSSYSQVCQISQDTEFKNLGSIYSSMTLEDQLLHLTIHSGSTCQELPNKFYETKVTLECSNVEDGPKFDHQDICTTYITWKTPHACPYHDLQRCSHIIAPKVNCEKCGFNLGGLSEKSPVRIVDPGNKSEFFVSACKPLEMEELPCIRNAAVIMKRPEEVHIKNRYVVMGFLSDMEKLNGTLVIESYGGFDTELYDSYHTKISFVCGGKENVVIQRRHETTIEFTWETPLVCPHNSEQSQCLFKLGDRIINLSMLPEQSFNFSSDVSTTIAHLCNNIISICKNDKCHEIIGNRSMNQDSMELSWKESQKSSLRIVKFQFVCRDTKETELSTNLPLTQGMFVVSLYSKLFCSQEREDLYPVKEETNFESNIESITEKLTTFLNCSLSNPQTGYVFDLKILNDVYDELASFSSCPTVSYMKSDKVVKLEYSQGLCTHNKRLNYTYHITMFCSENKKPNLTPFNETDCSKWLSYSDPKVCELFDEFILDHYKTKQAGTSTTIIVSITVPGILFLLFVLWVVYDKKLCRKEAQNRDSYQNLQIKDHEL